MPTLEICLAAAVLGSLAIYALTAGADFGGGFWDLFASGPRKREQRRAIAEAIGPIWEANHVWLILVVVIMFTAFPRAFGLIVVSLHIPLSIALLGIVFRGAAFVFRAYGEGGAAAERWGRLFGLASTVTPVALGVCLAAVSSGAAWEVDNEIRLGIRETRHKNEFLVEAPSVSSFLPPLEGWLPITAGLLVLALFAFLAAVYLTNEAKDSALREDFRRRALGAGVVAGILANVARALASNDADLLSRGLTGETLGWRYATVMGLLSASALWALWTRKWRLARLFAAGQVASLVVGWGIAMQFRLVAPSWDIWNSAAPRTTLEPLAWALGIGALFLFPSFYYLMTVFKGRQAFKLVDTKREERK